MEQSVGSHPLRIEAARQAAGALTIVRCPWFCARTHATYTAAEPERFDGRCQFNNLSISALRVGREMLAGEILYREAVQAGGAKDDFEPAWAKLRQAVALNDGRVPEIDDMPGATKNVFKLTGNATGLVYDEPWGWMQPVRHALGALLLDQVGEWRPTPDINRACSAVPTSSHFQTPSDCWHLAGPG